MLVGDDESDISIEQKPLGRIDVAITMFYTHVLSIGRWVLRSTWDSPASNAAPELPLSA